MGEGLVSRRQVLVGGALVTAAVLTPAGVIAAWAGSLSGDQRHLRRSTYVPLVGHSFRVEEETESAVALTLRAVGDLSPRTAPAGGEHAFVLRFEGPREPFVQSRSLAVEHPQLGRFPLAIFPVGSTAEHNDYEAIVNRVDR